MNANLSNEICTKSVENGPINYFSEPEKHWLELDYNFQKDWGCL